MWLRFSRMAVGLSCFLLMSGCTTFRDVDRYLYSASQYISHQDRITGARTLNLTSRDQAIRQGNQYINSFISKVRQSGGRVNEEVSARKYARVERIFQRVHSVSHLKDEDWQVYLVESSQFNAFTTGGTAIVLYTGLVDKVSSDQLAAIIGHEIAHVTADHIPEQQGYYMVAALSGSNSTYRDGFQSAFTHESEQEADEVGLLYTALSGYDPEAASAVWYGLYLKYGDTQDQYVDHPIYSERYRHTQKVGKQVKQYYQRNHINPRAEKILASNSIYTRLSISESKESSGAGVLSWLELLGSSYMKRVQVLTEQQRQTLRIIKSRQGY